MQGPRSKFSSGGGGGGGGLKGKRVRWANWGWGIGGHAPRKILIFTPLKFRKKHLK